MCARGLLMCGFSSHIFCWEDRAALTGIIFLEGLLGFAPHCLAVLLEPEVTSLLPAWGEDLQEVSPLQEKLEVGITLQTWGSREQKTTLEKLQEKCKRSEITSRPSLESHKSSWQFVAAVWPWITVWFRPLGSAAYLGALRSFVSPSGPWHTGVTPQTCFSRVLFVCTTWCHPELPTLSVWRRRACTIPTQSSLSSVTSPWVYSQLTACSCRNTIAEKEAIPYSSVWILLLCSFFRIWSAFPYSLLTSDVLISVNYLLANKSSHRA